MLPLKSSKPKVLLPSSSSPKLQTELAFWEQLQFSFDMDNEPDVPSNNDSRSRNTRRRRSASVSVPQSAGSSSNTLIQSDAQDATLLAQFAAAANMPSHGLSHPNPYGSLMSLGGYPHPGSSGFHENIFNQGDIGHTQLPPLSSLDFPWNHFPPPTHHHQDPFGQIQRTLSNPGTSSYQFGSASHAPENTSISNTASTSRQPRRASVHNPAVASSSTSSPDPENQTEAERIAIAEEKRRRNTAASARFRIKKKQRTTNLERSVSDLTGRAEDLEREAADLRRENGWLKEIVMLKGSRLAGVNLASRMAENTQRSSEGSSQAGPSRQKPSEPSSEDESSDEEVAKAKKKKGKSRKK